MIHEIDETSHWLTPGEQRTICSALVEANLIKWDNGRRLSLKSGGYTDVYANLRNVRSTVGATEMLAEVFVNPFRRMGINRFAEMPSAMSGVAGVLSGILRMPYITIRDTAKPGRVSDADIIGELKYGDRLGLFDDVVTDGDTKIGPFQTCVARGVTPAGLVVLIDRQQGWKRKFCDWNINLPVWSGMTLHDLRSFLIESRLMQRCKPEVEKENPLIIALDGKPWEEVLPIIDELRPTGCILKANDLAADGLNETIRRLSVYGRVMIDPKWHDIPNTVSNYCARLRETPPWAVTVHATGGSDMIRNAVQALSGTDTIVLAVTVLTSIKGECQEIYKRRPRGQVLRLAKIAWQAGSQGFVCSAEELGMLRKLYPFATFVVPGLRSPGAEKHDQRRVSTFTDAKKIGGAKTFFVGGRQFLENADPVQEIVRVLREELGVNVKV